jgi:hypothetical protein
LTDPEIEKRREFSRDEEIKKIRLGTGKFQPGCDAVNVGNIRLGGQPRPADPEAPGVVIVAGTFLMFVQNEPCLHVAPHVEFCLGIGFNGGIKRAIRTCPSK